MTFKQVTRSDFDAQINELAGSGIVFAVAEFKLIRLADSTYLNHAPGIPFRKSLPPKSSNRQV